jgi:hypothetical protein
MLIPFLPPSEVTSSTVSAQPRTARQVARDGAEPDALASRQRYRPKLIGLGE